MSANEERRLRRVAFEDLSYQSHLRILPMQRIRTIPDELPRHVLDGILANRIQSGRPNPPQRILYFETRHLRLFLVHVRQIIVEPAIERVPDFNTIGMW